MKRILFVLSLALGVAWGCTKAYDDTQIKEAIQDLEDRTAALKDLCSRVNTGIILVSRLEEACQLKTKVKDVVENKDQSGKVASYTVTLTDGSTLTITCPADGKDGYVGKPGADAQAPEISIKDYNGLLCWMIGGEFVRDENNNPIPVYAYQSGEQVKGRTPELKVENGKWYYRFDASQDWVLIPMVYGDGNVFSSVVDNGNDVVFELTAGGSITLPKVIPFSISLNNSSVEAAPGKSFEFSYVVQSEDSETKVEVFLPSKWCADIAEEKITVSLPADAVVGTKADVVVFATKTTGESVFQVLNVKVVAAS